MSNCFDRGCNGCDDCIGPEEGATQDACVDPMCACRGGPCAECPAGEREAALIEAYAEGRKDQLEELAAISLLLCWEAEELSEGQLSKLLDLDRVALREMRIEAIQAGMRLAEQMAKGAQA